MLMASIERVDAVVRDLDIAAPRNSRAFLKGNQLRKQTRHTAGVRYGVRWVQIRPYLRKSATFVPESFFERVRSGAYDRRGRRILTAT